MKPTTLLLLLGMIPLFVQAQIPILDARKEVNALLDQWHKDAASADFESYFDKMADDSRFLGTDETERWTKAEFMAYAKDAFDNKRTWEFIPSERKLTVEKGLKFAWFDEQLTTWMGPCRGSGVLIRTDDGWKIAQYNLAVLVPNEKINAYLELIGKPKKE